MTSTTTAPAATGNENTPQQMRAVVLVEEGAPEVLTLQQVDVPQPGPGEVRVRIRRAALNHLDAWIRKGLPSVPKPRIMGADGAGEVDALGAGVTGVSLGQAVLIDPSITCGSCRYCVAGDTALCNNFVVLGEHCAGTHAEYVVVPAINVHAIPAHMSFAQAAALPLVFGTAWRMIATRAQARPGERMLVWGASAGVGAAALQIAKGMGIETIATTRSADKLDALRELGATHVIDSSSEDVIERVGELTGGDGVEVVFDHLGETSWKPSIIAMARGGRFVTCGATTGPNPKAMITRIFWKQLSILGSTMASKRDFEQMLRFVAQQELVPHVDREFTLEQAAEAHTWLEASKHVGKVVFSVAD